MSLRCEENITYARVVNTLAYAVNYKSFSMHLLLVWDSFY